MIIWHIYNLLIILRRIIRKSVLDNTVETKDNLFITIFWVFLGFVLMCFLKAENIRVPSCKVIPWKPK